jgi:MFS family permease
MDNRNRFSGNTAFGLVGALVIAISFAIGRYLSANNDKALGTITGFVGFAIAMLFFALGPLVTGYSWQNLADRNQGPHRKDAPARFWLSVLLPTAVAVLACWVAISKSTNK